MILDNKIQIEFADGTKVNAKYVSLADKYNNRVIAIVNEERIVAESDKICSMQFWKPFYFEFGTDADFPYQNGYIIVYGGNINEAAHRFAEKYPSRDGTYVNCSEYYGHREWTNYRAEKYAGREAYEVLE